MTLGKIFKSVSAKEWQFVIFLSLAMILITLALLLYGWAVTPPGKIFTGTHFTAPNDWFVYYSYIEQVRQGNFLFENLFAFEPGIATLNIFWLLVGLVAKIFNLSNIFVFNLIRVILIPIFYFLAYLFIAYLFADAGKRKITLLVLSFASGLGILLLDRIIKYPFNFANGQFNWPLDLWVPEVNTFLTLYYSPHFILSLILILLIFFLTVLFAENQRFIYSLGTGVSALVLFAFHPFHVLTIFGVISVYFTWLILKARTRFWPLVRHYLILLLFSLPPIVYYLYLLKTDWLIQQKALQNLCFTPPLWITLFSYGLLLVLAVSGGYFLIKEKKLDNKLLFVLIWASVQFLLIYFPVNYQRRLTAGLHFPLVILTVIAIFGLYDLLNQQKNRWTKFLFKQRYTLLTILIFFLIISNLFQLAADFFIYTNQREFAYLDQEVVSAANWLKSIDEDKIIFNSANNVINVIPAYAGRKVYVGHGVETPNFKQKQQEVNWFFQTNRPAEVERNFLAKRNISYIFYSESEKKLGDYNPAEKAYLKEVYSNPKVKIYQVTPLFMPEADLSQRLMRLWSTPLAEVGFNLIAD